MPKTLILVRHSKAEERGLKTADIDRKLTGKGTEDSSKMARFLFRRGITPDHIISSNAARARLTAEIFAKDLNISEKNLKLTDKLYYSSAKTILDHIYVLDDKINTVLLVGHNPGISDLVRGLSSGRESFMENTQVVIFKYEIEKWHQLDEVNLIDFHSHRVIYTPGS